MAKKAYTLKDEFGDNWLVKEGDPAFSLLTKLVTQQKYPEPVLPMSTLRTGQLHNDNKTIDSHIRRLARGVELMPDDEDLKVALGRAVNLRACLELLSVGV